MSCNKLLQIPKEKICPWNFLNLNDCRVNHSNFQMLFQFFIFFFIFLFENPFLFRVHFLNSKLFEMLNVELLLEKYQGIKFDRRLIIQCDNMLLPRDCWIRFVFFFSFVPTHTYVNEKHIWFNRPAIHGHRFGHGHTLLSTQFALNFIKLNDD